MKLNEGKSIFVLEKLSVVENRTLRLRRIEPLLPLAGLTPISALDQHDLLDEKFEQNEIFTNSIKNF